MCSWCWAFRPVLIDLIHKLPSNIEIIRLLGGLAADSDDPMPEKTKQYVIDNWRRIQQQLPETKFNGNRPHEVDMAEKMEDLGFGIS